MTDMRQTAASLAAKGLRVFILGNDRKPTKTEYWKYAAATYAEAWEMWSYPDGSPRPDNIGVCTGDGLLVVDVDVKPNKTTGEPRRGNLSLQKLLILGLPEQTFRVRTASGGWHYYFKTPIGTTCRQVIGRAGTDSEGIDIKAHHCYVVGPGVERPDGVYEIESDVELAELPPEFVAMWQRRPTDVTPLEGLPDYADDDWATGRAIRMLVEAEAAHEGGENALILRLAHKCCDIGVTPDHAAELIIDHWLPGKSCRATPEEIRDIASRVPDHRQKAIGCDHVAEAFLPVDIEAQTDSAGIVKQSGPKIIDPTRWEGLTPKPREWIVPDLMPAGKVTLLYGDGGTGKSLLALQLCAAMALGRDWVGRNVRRGASLFFSAEDDADDLHERMDAIRRYYGVAFADMGAMRLWDSTEDNTIMGAKDASGRIVPTLLYRALDDMLAREPKDLIVIDTLADVFGGDEMRREQANQFIGMFRQLCVRRACTVLVLAHPSVASIAAGRGTAGTTGWNGSVRSRLFLSKEDRDDVRTLRAMKANYGPTGGETRLMWQAGVLVPLAGPAVDVEAELDARFMEAVRRIAGRGLTLCPNTGRGFIVAMVRDELGMSANEAGFLPRAFNRLLDAGQLKVVITGSESRRREKVEIC